MHQGRPRSTRAGSSFKMMWMNRSQHLAVICIGLFACAGNKGGAGAGWDNAKDRDRDAPMRIAFGDCTSSPVPFVSGPRPRSLQADDADTVDKRTLYPPDPSALLPPGGASTAAAALDPRSAAALTTAPYQPGAYDPLRQIEPALVACLRGTTFGAMTVDLELDPTTGQVTRATTATTDTKLAACIAAAARTVKLESPGPRLQRCGFAYGAMPSASVPTITITATDITFNGKVVDRLSHVLTDSSSSLKIEPLFDALDAWQKQPPPHGTVPIRGPGLLEPLDQTPMEIVTKSLFTAYAADADFVLAAQRGSRWVPLRAGIVLPVAPVPLGSGGRWGGAAIGHAGRPTATDERVVISVLVTSKRIWIVMSRINDFQEILGRDFAKLEQALEEHKHSRFFTDRTDLEIAGADDVLYGDVVKTIELATKVGFTDWKVLPPAGLTARPPL